MKPSLSCLPNQSWLRNRFFVIDSLSPENLYFDASELILPADPEAPMPVDRRNSAAALTGGASYPSLRGRSVFITGGGSGIGACLTESFARQGSLVAFVDISEAPSQALVQQLESEGL